MIAIDTSALLAIVFNEPERAAFLGSLEAAPRILISSVTVAEARMVVHGRKGERGVILLDQIIGLPKFEILPPGEEELTIIHGAFVTYGKGSGHPARLNFGDLFSYALAKSRGVPLLFKGNDFVETDIEVAAALDG